MAQRSRRQRRAVQVRRKKSKVKNKSGHKTGRRRKAYQR